MLIYILRVGGRNLVSKNHSKVLLTLFLEKERLHKGLMPWNHPLLRDLPLMMLIIMLADPVLAGRANVAIGEVADEPEHGRQPANLTNPIVRLDNSSIVLCHAS
jgi:hypothetical protein